MLYAVRCVDAEGVNEVRNKVLTPHKDYLKGQAHILVLGGALVDDADAPVGSLYIVNVPDRKAAEAFSKNDPFSSAASSARSRSRPCARATGIRVPPADIFVGLSTKQMLARHCERSEAIQAGLTDRARRRRGPG
ncbi:MAG: YciI family protein, partial [Pseudomonadota bacterium]